MCAKQPGIILDGECTAGHPCVRSDAPRKARPCPFRGLITFAELPRSPVEEIAGR